MEPRSPQAKTFTLYGLKHPDENIIRYVGITCEGIQRRLRRHLHASGKGSNPHKDRWVAKMSPLRPDIFPYAVELTFEEACYLEKYVLKNLRAAGHDLINIAEGGEAGPRNAGEKHYLWGKKRSVESRQKTSLSLLGNKNAVGNTNCRGKTIPLKVRLKISASLTGRSLSETTRAKLSLAMKGKRNNPNGRRK